MTMSIFGNLSLDCPACNTPVDYALVHSVNADSGPELRSAILDGSFQRQACPSCQHAFRVEPEFIYMDLARKQYIGVWPASKRGQWRACAAQTRKVFDDAMGKNAPREARALGEKLVVRAVFGWPALVEKILARQAGIDDRTLEVAKLAVMRSQEELPMPGSSELRLVGERDGDALLAWVGGHTNEDAPIVLRVPRKLFADIEADPATWQAARDITGEGDMVDFQREMLVS
jgi:CpXC protein